MKPDPCFTMFHDFAIRFCQGASVDTLKSHYNDLVSFVRNLSPEARHGRSMAGHIWTPGLPGEARNPARQSGDDLLHGGMRRCNGQAASLDFRNVDVYLINVEVMKYEHIYIIFTHMSHMLLYIYVKTDM